MAISSEILNIGLDACQKVRVIGFFKEWHEKGKTIVKL